MPIKGIFPGGLVVRVAGNEGVVSSVYDSRVSVDGSDVRARLRLQTYV